ncbi:endonuclease domain-containing protein [Streptomyces griseocarneus]|nr:endonuclease VII domain-containing protein [Streptomyces griseocarneus]
MLVWTADTWLIPRTLAHILDQWQEAEAALKATTHPCSGCGAPDKSSSWRTSTTNGWKVLCPACSAASLRHYRQELKGIAHSRVREHGPRAREYLCAVCRTPRPATDWDHCHEHGLIRGPLCGSCNTKEGQGKEFLALPDSVPHLLRCDGCRAQRTLPPHHRLAALRRHLHLQWGAQGCDWPMHMCVAIDESGGSGYECRVRCPEKGPSRSRSLHLTVGEAEHILALTVETGPWRARSNVSPTTVTPTTILIHGQSRQRRSSSCSAHGQAATSSTVSAIGAGKRSMARSRSSRRMKVLGVMLLVHGGLCWGVRRRMGMARGSQPWSMGWCDDAATLSPRPLRPRTARCRPLPPPSPGVPYGIHRRGRTLFPPPGTRVRRQATRQQLNLRTATGPGASDMRWTPRRTKDEPSPPAAVRAHRSQRRAPSI